MDLIKRSRCQHYQYKTACETLLRLVDARLSLTPAELEANASPSAKFVIGNELVQPTSSGEIVKARCSCVDQTFPEWLATNCRGLHYSPVALNTEKISAIIADRSWVVLMRVHLPPAFGVICRKASDKKWFYVALPTNSVFLQN